MQRFVRSSLCFGKNLCGPAGYLNSFRSLVPTEVERNWKLVEMQKTDTGGAAGPLGPCQDANRPPAGGREYSSGPVRWPGSMVRTRPPWPRALTGAGPGIGGTGEADPAARGELPIQEKADHPSTCISYRVGFGMVAE